MRSKFVGWIALVGLLAGCAEPAKFQNQEPKAPAFEGKPRVEDIANTSVREVFKTQPADVCYEYAELYAAVAEAVEKDSTLNRDLSIYLLGRARDNYPPNTLPNVPGLSDVTNTVLAKWLDRNQPVAKEWRTELAADLMSISAGAAAAAK